MTGCVDCGRRCHGRRCRFCERDRRQETYLEPVLKDDWHDEQTTLSDQERDEDA